MPAQPQQSRCLNGFPQRCHPLSNCYQPSRFGFSYLQPVAKRHDIKPNITVRNGYKSRDIEKPLMEFAKKDGNAGRLRMIFEIGLEATGNREEILKKL